MDYRCSREKLKTAARTATQPRCTGPRYLHLLSHHRCYICNSLALIGIETLKEHHRGRRFSPVNKSVLLNLRNYYCTVCVC
ncbi:unnamed protein product [Lactuca virosa]|uniref:Uncharacterized protein n=1 Tax=Lactuca virosa TaxID=75947 RepID=A0AAU9PUA2_9ASTR|nr:unnamed protein product [Lactuca virosa]